MNQKSFQHNLVPPRSEYSDNYERTGNRNRREVNTKNVLIALGLTAMSFWGIKTFDEGTPPAQEQAIEIVENSNKPFSRTGIFDGKGEGGISVFVDTISDERPDLIVTKVIQQNDVEEEIVDFAETVKKIEAAYRINVVDQGNRIQAAMGGNVERWEKILIDYDGQEFSYTKEG